MGLKTSTPCSDAERRAAVSAAATPSRAHAVATVASTSTPPERHIASDAQDKGATPKSKSAGASASAGGCLALRRLPACLVHRPGT